MRSNREQWLLRHRITGQTRWSTERPSEDMWEVVRAGGTDSMDDYESTEWQAGNAQKAERKKPEGSEN